MRCRVLITSLLAVLALAGCAGFASMTHYYSPSFKPGEEGGATGSIPLIVRGNAYAIPQAEFDAAVAAAMQGNTMDRPIAFILAGNSVAAYRTIVAFNPGANVNDAALCARPLPTITVFGTAPTPTTQFAAAVCRGDSPLTAVEGAISTAGGPTSAGFREGVAQMTRLLFPSFNPENQGGPDVCPMC